LDVLSIATLGVTSTTNLTTQNLSVTGISTLGTVLVDSGIITATSGIVTYYGDGSGLINTPPGSPTGSNTQIQYNDAGNFGASPNLTFDGTTTRILSGIITTLSGTNISYSGVGTIVTLDSTNGTITNLTGTSGTITTLNSTDGTITNLTGTSGTITNLTGTSGTITTLNSTNGTITNLTGTDINYSGIASVGIAITMYGSTGIISATKYYGDGSSLSGIDATRIINGTSNVTVASGSTISATVGGQNIFNITGTGVTMVAGKRLDVSSYSETVQTLGSSGSPISGTNALDIGIYSTFIAYVGTSAVTFTLTGAVSGRLSSWTLILIYTNSGTRSVSFSFGTLRYPGGSSSVVLSNTQVHDILSFFTADNATNTYGTVVGLGFTT
jgi:hypothetical protein